MKPKVSIITPLYNSERFVAKAIDSVLCQTYENWEMIIVDDCSKDNSIDIVKRFQKKESRIRLFQLEENSGSGIARNKAIEESSGEIIAFLDSDDIWLPKKLELHVNFMLKNDASFSHASYGFINEDGNKINKTYHVSSRPIGYYDLLKRTEISCLTAMYNVKKIGKFYMPNLRRKQDYGLWLSILKTGVKSIPLDEELAFYRQVKGSATNNKRKLIFKHLVFLYKYQKLGVFRTIYYFTWWALNGVKKYYINRYFG
ncbi:glycosyltransferase family 2 protein [Aquimarina sp. AD1]|uniref:glycosyltransferase family 2 protein n=1 Tax=Aquimarina sp. (strain AD1) TaxID=1714848 RepID=UPI000E4E91F8|nr:glycosyltransferase family 2 protein [Aquimarina sp. AD1]AXT57340.1 glycosyltransferase family 2 protein [Aquimarina sp. AD1]